jgi:hypothetical protein
MEEKQNILGDEYEVLSSGKVIKGDYWYILDGKKTLILNLPNTINENDIEEILSDYKKLQWGKFYNPFKKRTYVVVREYNINKLESSLFNITET